MGMFSWWAVLGLCYPPSLKTRFRMVRPIFDLSFHRHGSYWCVIKSTISDFFTGTSVKQVHVTLCYPFTFMGFRAFVEICISFNPGRQCIIVFLLLYCVALTHWCEVYRLSHHSWSVAFFLTNSTCIFYSFETPPQCASNVYHIM